MEITEFCLNMSKLSLPLHFHPSARGSSHHQSCQSESQGSNICVRSFCLLFVEWVCMTQPDGPASSPCWSKQRENTYWPLFEGFLLLLHRVMGNHLSLAWRSINIPPKDLFSLNHHGNLVCRVGASTFFEFWKLTYTDLFHQLLMWSHLWNISQLSSEGENLQFSNVT